MNCVHLEKAAPLAMDQSKMDRLYSTDKCKSDLRKAVRSRRAIEVVDFVAKIDSTARLQAEEEAKR